MKFPSTLKARLRAWAERRAAAIAADHIRLTELRIEQLRQQQTDSAAVATSSHNSRNCGLNSTEWRPPMTTRCIADLDTEWTRILTTAAEIFPAHEYNRNR